MTTASTPEEVRALADRLEHCVAKWGKQNALSLEAYSAVKMMRRLQDDNERLQGSLDAQRLISDRAIALAKELEARLVAEARATAEHKLRADQLAQQHRMQAQMHAQATQQLAELEARKPLPVSIERLDELWASQRSFHGGEPLKMGHVEFARLIEVEYGVLGRIPIREENGGQIDHSLIASREIVADGPVRVTRLHLTEEGRAALTSKATGPLPGIKET